MTRSYIDKTEAVTALRATVPDVVYAIRNIQDPNAKAVGEWATAEVAAHLVDAAEDNLKAARGEGTPYSSPSDVAATNEKRLSDRRERDPQKLSALYEQAMDRYLDYLNDVEGDPIVPWGDFEIPVSTLIAADIGEALVHGWDITHAEGRPWTIDPYKAGLVGKGLSPMTINYVDPEAAAGFTGTFDLRLRGQCQLHFVFANGELAIEEPTKRPVDAHISADPVAFMLVAYGRISQWGPIAKGQVLAWGRKPWLALKFATLLRKP